MLVLRLCGGIRQVRGPLSALRTLGAMLVPRTQDVTRDVADGIVVQVMHPFKRAHHDFLVHGNRAGWIFSLGESCDRAYLKSQSLQNFFICRKTGCHGVHRGTDCRTWC